MTSAQRLYARAGFDAVPDSDFHHYHATFHTSAEELGALAARARPAALLLTHQLYFGRDDATLISEVRAGGYAGPVTSGEDLGVY